MTNSSTNGWEVQSWPDAWRVVVGADHENPAETESNVENILCGYDGPFISALEIGAGYGRLVKAMRKRFDFVLGVDSSQALVDLSREYVVGYQENCIVKNSGSDLPAKSEFFNFVYSYIAFQHMHTLDIIKSYIAETFRVLKPGGICRIQTVKGKSNPFMGEGGIHRCHLFEDEKDFGQLFCDAGFDTDVVVGNTHPSHIWVTGRKP
jgi:SAM-dependent methyltransferase